MVDGLVERLRSIVGVRGTVSARPRLIEDWRQQLHECAEARGGEVSARSRAAALAQTYLQLDDAGRKAFLKLIALEFGPDPARVATAPPELELIEDPFPDVVSDTENELGVALDLIEQAISQLQEALRLNSSNLMWASIYQSYPFLFLLRVTKYCFLKNLSSNHFRLPRNGSLPRFFGSR